MFTPINGNQKYLDKNHEWKAASARKRDRYKKGVKYAKPIHLQECSGKCPWWADCKMETARVLKLSFPVVEYKPLPCETR